MARKRTGPAKLSDGFLQTAWDFHRAARAGRFHDSERLLLDEAHEIAWAPGLLDGTRLARPFKLPLSEIARHTGHHRNTLSRAYTRLVMYRVFVLDPSGDGSRWINKDYRQWLDADGGPRFTADQLAWIDSAGPWSDYDDLHTSCGAGRHNRQVRPAPSSVHLEVRPAPSSVQSGTTGPLPQHEATSPLNSDGTPVASARANSDSKKRIKYPPKPPKGGDGMDSPRASGGRGDGGTGGRRGGGAYDWDALAERDTDVEV